LHESEGLSTANLLEALIAPAVEAAGYRLVRLKLMGGKRKTLQIMAERPDGQMDVEDCALLSRAVSEVLEASDPLAEEYVLEVSSPGLDRKLVKAADYARFDGKLAKIQTRIPLQHQKVFKGRLRGLQNGNIRLETPKGDLMEIPLDVVHEARLEFDWEAEMARSKAESASEREEK